jgi:hypothetical protein
MGAIEPIAKVVKSFPLNTIRKTDISINNQIEGELIIIASHTMLCEIPFEKIVISLARKKNRLEKTVIQFAVFSDQI